MLVAHQIFAVGSKDARVEFYGKHLGAVIKPTQKVCVLQRLPRPIRKAKQKQPGENCEIGREMRWETPVLTGVTETAAGDIESANFRSSDGEREDDDQRN